MTTTASPSAQTELATDRPLVHKLPTTMRWWHVFFLLGLANLAFVFFGLIGLTMTGYAFDAALTNPTAWMHRIVVVGIIMVVAATVSYVAAQRQQGRPVRLTDPSREEPSAEAWAGIPAG